MTDLPIPPNPGEVVLKETEAVYPKSRPLALGYSQVAGRLWLTGQRLVFHSPEARLTLTLPVRRIKSAAPDSHQIKTRSAGAEFTQTSTLMRLDFDDGGREYFAVKDIAGWTEGITAAQREAPPLDYVTRPGRRQGVETTTGQIVMWIAGGLISLCLAGVCCVTLTLFSPAILTLLSNNGR